MIGPTTSPIEFSRARSALHALRIAAAACGCAVFLGSASAHAARASLREIPREPSFSLRAASLQDSAPSSARQSSLALDDASQRALQRGLDWLSAKSVAGTEFALPLGDAARAAPLGVHSLALLALLAGGSTPGRGPHGAAIDRALDWLLRQADADSSSPTFGYFHSGGDEVSRMHGHGFATLALAEAWCVGRAHRRGADIGRTLRAAVALIERTQGTQGGWGYDPKARFEHEGSITICLVQALRAARDAGVKVDVATIRRAEAYVVASQDEDGAFRYMLGDPRRSVALTAAAMATLNMAGEYRGPVLERGLDALRRGLVARESGGVLKAPGRPDEEVLCPFYERLYVAQALWQLPDERVFAEWSRRERKLVLDAQRDDGSWNDPRFGPSYATAVNCLVLALPLGYLPVFQR